MRSLHLYAMVLTGVSVTAAQTIATASTTTVNTITAATSDTSTAISSTTISDTNGRTIITSTTDASDASTALSSTSESNSLTGSGTQTTTPDSLSTSNSASSTSVSSSSTQTSSTQTSVSISNSTAESSRSPTITPTSTSFLPTTTTTSSSAARRVTLPASTDASQYLSYAFPPGVAQPTWATGSYYTMLASALYSVDKSFVQRSDYPTIISAIESAADDAGNQVSVSVGESAWAWGLVTTAGWYQTRVPTALQTEVLDYNSAWHSAASSVRAKATSSGGTRPKIVNLVLTSAAAVVAAAIALMA